jgi:hypothetical protein
MKSWRVLLLALVALLIPYRAAAQKLLVHRSRSTTGRLRRSLKVPSTRCTIANARFPVAWDRTWS